MYQNDAARRVIARLIRERDEARSLLANAGANGVALAPNGGAPVDTALTPAILERMERLQGEYVLSLSLASHSSSENHLMAFGSLVSSRRDRGADDVCFDSAGSSRAARLVRAP